MFTILRVQTYIKKLIYKNVKIHFEKQSVIK